MKHKIAVIGAGFTGLSAGYELIKAGHEVVIFEKGKNVGGLATNFKPSGWKWGLEKYYHHIFAGDKQVINLAKELDWPAFFSRPITNSLIGGEEKQLDSLLSLLRFSALSFWARLHMGAGLAGLKMIRRPNGFHLGRARIRMRSLKRQEPSEETGSEPPFAWLSLERYRVVDVLPKLVGGEGYKKVWEPLLKAKFGSFLPKINMAWFWARVNKRTAKLGYFRGGFGMLAEKIAEEIVRMGGEIRLETEWDYIYSRLRGNDRGDDGDDVRGGFDKVLFTVPAPLQDKKITQSEQFRSELRTVPMSDFSDEVSSSVDYLWGQTLVLELDKPLMKGYWLNILEKDWPFLVVVEQTNFIDKKYYGGKHVVYLGNYLEGLGEIPPPATPGVRRRRNTTPGETSNEKHFDKRLKMNSKELLELYLPYIKKINPDFKKSWIKRKWKFQSPFAQPVFPINYSRLLPSIKTGVPGVYAANMSMVYPWDRGVNFALELGQRAAKMIANGE